ncbi:hypothetical protein KUB3006_P11060 (plasmid) [Enterococcus faecalis]|nr:hypothetical protein KUB3006_P11060 [Enterococcus faecalis]BBD29474.1 hypothetical protein KUB3007_P11060 [Enterococcus faecalis]
MLMSEYKSANIDEQKDKIRVKKQRWQLFCKYEKNII